MATFVELLPKIEHFARGYFHFVRCLATRDDLVAETMALTWKWYLKLEADGRNPCDFVGGIVKNAARAAYSGRGFANSARKKDAMNPFERRFLSLPMHSTLNGSIFDEALHDPAWPVPDQAARPRVTIEEEPVARIAEITNAGVGKCINCGGEKEGVSATFSDGTLKGHLCYAHFRKAIEARTPQEVTVVPTITIHPEQA